MILSGPVRLIIGPGGRQSVPHESEAGFASRVCACSRAQGKATDGVKSESYFGAASQSPDRSGLPSAVRGAGADRFAFPSPVRGMPGVGCVNHCAKPVASDRMQAAKASGMANMRAGRTLIESLGSSVGADQYGDTLLRFGASRSTPKRDLIRRPCVAVNRVRLTPPAGTLAH